MEDDEELLNPKEAQLLKAFNPIDLANYAQRVRKAPWPEAERIILKSFNADAMVNYARAFYPQGWPKAEARLLQQGKAADLFAYAKTVRKDRWKEAEPVLARARVREQHLPIAYAVMTKSRFKTYENALREAANSTGLDDKARKKIEALFELYRDALKRVDVVVPDFGQIGRNPSASKSALEEQKRDRASQMNWSF